MGVGTILLIVVACIVVVVPLLFVGAGFVAGSTGKYTEAQRMQATIDARTIHPAAEKYRIDHPGAQCAWERSA